MTLVGNREESSHLHVSLTIPFVTWSCVTAELVLITNCL